MEKTKNLYQCSIKSFFGSPTYFNVEATDKADALVKAKEYARVNIEWGGNYDPRSVTVIKKIQKKQSKNGKTTAQ